MPCTCINGPECENCGAETLMKNGSVVADCPECGHSFNVRAMGQPEPDFAQEVP